MNKLVFSLTITTLATGVFPGQTCADHLSGGFDLGQNSAILTESAIPLPQGSWYTSLSAQIVENQSFSDDKLIGLRTFDILV